MRKRYARFVFQFVGWFTVLFFGLVAYISAVTALQSLERQRVLDSYAYIGIAFVSLFALLLAALFTMVCAED